MDRAPRENPAPEITGRETPPSSATDARRPRETVCRGQDEKQLDEERLDEGLEETFPGSGPVSVTRRTVG